MSGDGLTGFLSMGGYGLYVWGSLGMCAAALAIEVTLLKLRRRTLLREMADDRAAQAERTSP